MWMLLIAWVLLNWALFLLLPYNTEADDIAASLKLDIHNMFANPWIRESKLF